MARPRTQSFGEGLKTPHSISLKVLRLTRPSLTPQHPLPSSSTHPHESALIISPKASLAYPDPQPNSSPFILTPILQLPESFQAAYVGEVFAATLCANNELSQDEAVGDVEKKVRVRNVKIAAEMLGPGAGEVGGGVPLELEGDGSGDVEGWLGEGETLQRVLRLSLREEGPHTLGVTVSYVEVVGEAGRNVVRTFRKLYQFVAMPLLGVRTKAGDVAKGKDVRVKYAVEAQLENVGERVVVLEAVSLSPKAPFTSTSLNWDNFGTGTDPAHAPILNPRDVMQVAFLLEEQRKPDVVQEEEKEAMQDIHNVAPGDKIILGQLNIQWTSAMGDRGSLSTGWLVARKR